ncbi:toll/interleukin-1 receptor domain-containing protein [Arthrobacter cheniae]|nr:toll/interleukin-1 receptor domain-containing protein [Arthrobacter cheniae]
MKVFVSWSGGTSKAFAKEVVWWLNSVLFPVEPWMSDSDISPGDRSLAEIEAGLNGAQFGILCVTAENQTAPWLNFEAGAISKEVNGETGKVVPLLIDMSRPTQLTQSTLSQFQAVVADKAGFEKLAHAVNSAMGDHHRTVEQLNSALETYWPQLQKRLAAVPKGTAPVKPRRKVEDMVEEVLEIVRKLQREEDQIPSSPFLQGGSARAKLHAVDDFLNLHPDGVEEITNVARSALNETGYPGEIVSIELTNSGHGAYVMVVTTTPLPERVTKLVRKRLLNAFPMLGGGMFLPQPSGFEGR